MKPAEGMWWGIVHSTKDPEHRNRIQVKCPDVLGSEISEWAEPDSLALSTLKIGDKLWIRFLAGDIRHPVYHIPYDKRRAILTNTLTNLDLRHPTGPITVRAGGTASVSGSSSSINMTGGKVHNRAADAGGYVASVASAFEIGSSEELKENVRVLDFDPIATVQAAPAKLWNYVPDYADDKTRIGPIAETLPDLVRSGDHVDLAALVGVLWAAVDHLSRRVADLENPVE